jgi:hypothetical protein
MPRSYSEGINPSTGEYFYREHKKATRVSGPTPDQVKWWDSLSEGHREVIRWHTETFGRHNAAGRNLDLQAFSRSKGRDHAPYLKGPEQHEFAYEHFEEFKAFCLQKHTKP